MRLSTLQHSVKARLRHPGWWAAAIALAMVPGLYGLLLQGLHTFRTILVILWTDACAILALFLCPSPWQWTSDDRLMAGWWRGLLQFLLFGALMAGVLSPLWWFTKGGTPKDAYHLGESLGMFLPFLLFVGPAGWVVARVERLAQETREAQARARETQWMCHRGAFSPRLLFSNLNHLASLASNDTQHAEQGLLDLAALYRRWLTEAELPLVPLGTERSLTEQYLALERGRWGDRLKLRWHLIPDLDGLLVPPLLLQPLLESFLGQEPGGVDVELRETILPRGRAELWIRVLGPGPAPEEPLIQRLRQRLQSDLGSDADATVVAFPEGWQVAIHFPPQKDEVQP